jgi:hypothetical protein
VALSQPIKPGISSLSVTSIPEKWSAQWFRSFVTTHLQSLDARNQIAGTGITLTPPVGGNVSVPGTVSVSSDVQSLFKQPYVFATTPIAPTNPLDAQTGYRILAAQTGVLTVTDGGATHPITVGVAANGISNALLAQPPANSVLGNNTGAVANVTDIAASANGQILSLIGGVIGFNLLGANPTAAIGLTAVNGTALTYMTSDSAPALSQAITPTWTALHTFNAGITVVGSVTVNTQATTGAKTASFAATNKPGTNNQTTPSTWLPVTLDGTTYYLPAFAA